MTTKVSDERLAALANWWGGDTQLALHELQEKRALVKECEEALKITKTHIENVANIVSKAQYEADELEQGSVRVEKALTDLSEMAYNGTLASIYDEIDALLARVRGEL